MSNPDFLLYVVHAAFWGCFGLARVLFRTPAGVPSPGAGDSLATECTQTARFSRVLVAFHGVAFGVMYFGIANAVLPDRVPVWFAGQRIVGGCLIGGGAVLILWALVFFRSWRFRAKLDQGHQLATEGPFRLLRHPIYMGLNLLALGTAVWVPSAVVWIAFLLMVLGSDLRARSEETILAQAFGSTYAAYFRRTSRFIPGVY